METLGYNLHHWREWNWGGLVFVLGIFPLTMFLHWWMRQWAQRPERDPELDSLMGEPEYDVRRRGRYVAPPHQHVCDFDRSEIVVREDNNVEAYCSVSGCGVSMVLGRDIAGAFFVERPDLEVQL